MKFPESKTSKSPVYNEKIDRNARLAEEWESGATMIDIARRYDIHPSTVWKKLLRYFEVIKEQIQSREGIAFQCRLTRRRLSSDAIEVEPALPEPPAMAAMNADLWRHKAAIAIHDAERPIAMRGLRESRRFKADLARTLELHRSIIDRLSGFATATPYGDLVLTGAWCSPDVRPNERPALTAVVSLPSLKRHHDIEKPLRNLGELLGYTTRALSVAVRGIEDEIELLWHHEDIERIDITEERALIDLLEYLRWETDDVIVRRFREISDAVHAGRVPGPPSYLWPAT
ncbi:hypothetical protein JHL17_08645 [Azospirillum sp. YIM B02556]|uniref:Uncharacterized protein n=1 Tax=Azospirillum endophyticum TaxID=2800326 RepID=A0ABS1F246_9PROT|nr:hypothetical protein [Azospirillum endophyticum]MBK1837479.1 hypothetical protein [Azospirillum endophyticum]